MLPFLKAATRQLFGVGTAWAQLPLVFTGC